jgi:hypothetical protein
VFEEEIDMGEHETVNIPEDARRFPGRSTNFNPGAEKYKN